MDLGRVSSFDASITTSTPTLTTSYRTWAKLTGYVTACAECFPNTCPNDCSTKLGLTPFLRIQVRKIWSYSGSNIFTSIFGLSMLSIVSLRALYFRGRLRMYVRSALFDSNLSGGWVINTISLESWAIKKRSTSSTSAMPDAVLMCCATSFVLFNAVIPRWVIRQGSRASIRRSTVELKSCRRRPLGLGLHDHC